ncbi:hypothetical protein KP78_30430 [Jeotgalibacillus soli]|uniref:Uncharacterized protein n=1 Tax=Jeotgalibacillus soli TaxID=889306 RepID=A0A0C2RUW8_9BACL|nr:hypothetical protein KP78_30430 [Jeotgalibacillus soli]
MYGENRTDSGWNGPERVTLNQVEGADSSTLKDEAINSRRVEACYTL